ncbi:hydroxycarboxylic acid receptor 2-like [Hoplias malabaricus]|uniref:hydroxycarboxylic acid receptor 2-like n=1 Tax=Hoplias malabaricus TaxID=27720 RepID=UPI0034637AA5
MKNVSECCTFDTSVLDQVLPPVLILEFIFGLFGNILVLWIFAFYMDTWKPNSIYLVHLAVADLVVLFCLPFRADYYLRGRDWIYGDAFCRILLFLVASNRAASIFFLTAVTVDRYLKIVHPLHRINRMKLTYAQWVSCGLWISIIAFTADLVTYNHLNYNNRTQCETFNICLGNNPVANWNSTFYVMEFFVPVNIIIFCSARITCQLKNKTRDAQGKIKKVIQFIFVVALVFIVCFFPSTITQVAVLILKTQYNECHHFSEASVAFYSSLCFTYFHSMLNPLVYYFASPAFKGHFKKLIMKLRWKTTRKQVPGNLSSLAMVTDNLS